MNVTTADQRSLVGVAPVFTWQPLDGDGDDATPAGTVTVTITRADGTVLVTAAATTGTAPVTYTGSVAFAAVTDVLTATWTDNGTVRATTTLEIVGGYAASIAQIRASDSTLANVGKYPPTDVVRARTECEQSLARLTARDFTPRYHLERLDGSGRDTLVLGWGPLRSVRSVTVYSGTTGTAFTAGELAAIPANDGRLAVRTDGAYWPRGCSNIVIGYESGDSSMPFDLRDQFFIEVRKQLNDANTTGQRATPFDYPPDEMMDTQDAQQLRRFFATLNGYSLRTPGIA